MTLLMNHFHMLPVFFFCQNVSAFIMSHCSYNYRYENFGFSLNCEPTNLGLYKYLITCSYEEALAIIPSMTNKLAKKRDGEKEEK